MRAFQRLSSGPTIPEQLDAQCRAWRSIRTAAARREVRVAVRFWAAELLLRGATLLLRLRAIEPAAAGSAFEAAARLTRDGMRDWSEGRAVRVASRRGRPSIRHDEGGNR